MNTEKFHMCNYINIHTLLVATNGNGIKDVVWDMMPCGSSKNRRFGGTCRPQLQGNETRSEDMPHNGRWREPLATAPPRRGYHCYRSGQRSSILHDLRIVHSSLQNAFGLRFSASFIRVRNLSFNFFWAILWNFLYRNLNCSHWSCVSHCVWTLDLKLRWLGEDR
jgi:hypothetical protein